MRQCSDNKTRDLFGRATPDERHEARQRAAAYWMPIIRQLLQQTLQQTLQGSATTLQGSAQRGVK